MKIQLEQTIFLDAEEIKNLFYCVNGYGYVQSGASKVPSSLPQDVLIWRKKNLQGLSAAIQSVDEESNKLDNDFKFITECHRPHAKTLLDKDGQPVLMEDPISKEMVPQPMADPRMDRYVLEDEAMQAEYYERVDALNYPKRKEEIFKTKRPVRIALIAATKVRKLCGIAVQQANTPNGIVDINLNYEAVENFLTEEGFTQLSGEVLTGEKPASDELPMQLEGEPMPTDEGDNVKQLN